MIATFLSYTIAAERMKQLHTKVTYVKFKLFIQCFLLTPLFLIVFMSLDLLRWGVVQPGIIQSVAQTWG